VVYLNQIAEMGSDSAQDYIQQCGDVPPMTGKGIINCLSGVPTCYPRDWSLTDETSEIEYPGLPEMGSLLPRLQTLTEHYPGVYGSTVAVANHLST
jgi:hypothetical protein